MGSGPITSWQTEGETVAGFIFLGSKINMDGNCATKLRHLLLGRKTMTNLDSILKSRGITLPTKVRIVKAVFFPVVMYGSESWTRKKTWRIYSFELRCWRKLLGVPWTTKRPNQSILKEISPECSLEGLILKLKLQYFGLFAKSSIFGKGPDAGKDWGQEEKGATENEMVGWHHRLNGLEFEQTQGDSEGQRSPVCCSPWGYKELDTT